MRGSYVERAARPQRGQSTAGHYCIIRAKSAQNSSEHALHSPVGAMLGQVVSMSDAVIRRESAVEYFKELVDGALSHQRLGRTGADLVLRRPAADGLSPAARGVARRRPDAARAAPRRRRSKAAASQQRATPARDRRRFALHVGLFRRIADTESSSTSTTTSASAAAPTTRSAASKPTHSRRCSPNSADKFVGFVDVLQRSQRAHVLRIERRSAAAVREVAEDRQPAQRPAAGRAGRRAERVDPYDTDPVAATYRSASYESVRCALCVTCP